MGDYIGPPRVNPGSKMFFFIEIKQAQMKTIVPKVLTLVNCSRFKILRPLGGFTIVKNQRPPKTQNRLFQYSTEI